MKPKNKKIMTVGLALAAVGIWIPQILMGVVQPARAERPEVGNAAFAFEPAILGGESNGAAAMPGTAEDSTPSTHPAGAESLSRQLEATDGRADRRRRGAAQRIDLDELMRTFRSGAGAAVEIAPKEHELGGALQPSLNPDVPALQGRHMLDLFIEATSLNAVILDDAGSVAMLGDRLVRVGDVLEGGVRVTQIERRSVTLSARGEERVLGLPAFHAREAQDGSGSSGKPESCELPGASDEVDGPSSTPADMPGVGGLLEMPSPSADGAPGSAEGVN